jgi:hypothetical protein
MTDIDLDAYREHNDIAPDEPAPRTPRGEPDEILDEYKVWLFDAEESDTIPDTFVVDRHPEPLDFRMWVFVGRGDAAHFSMRASHKYGPDEVVAGGQDDCCEVLLAGESLTNDHCPAEVFSIVTNLANAAVITPGETSENDHGGPIDY